MEITFYLLDNTYEVIGGEPHIIIWGIRDDGERIVLRDRRFRPYFYAILSENADIDGVVGKIRGLSEPRSPIINISMVEKRYFGNPVRALKITTVIPEYVRKYREKVKDIPGIIDVVEADIRFSLRYLIDHDLRPCGWHTAEVAELPLKPAYRVSAEYEIIGDIKPIENNHTPDLKVTAFDIEVYAAYGTPRPERDPVIIIGVMDNHEGRVKQFIAKDKDDKKVIASFVEYVKKYDPDIMIGYNSNGFDWPYLVERSKKIGVKLDVGRRIGSIPRTSTYGHISIAGRLNVDMYDFAEEIPEVKVKTLENVADYLGIMRKDQRVIIDYSEMPRYWDDPKLRPTFLKYNEHDVISTYGLGEKFIPFAIQLSNITGLPLDQVGAASVGFRLEWYLMREAYKYNELVPNRVERQLESYKGAVVLKPVKGIHENIAVLDFSSMYPNIMIKYNVGPDTIVRGPCNPGEHNIAPEVKHCFRKEPDGFFKRVLRSLLEIRKKLKAEMKKHPPDSYEYRLLNERQKAVKVLANATYGYMGWAGARWYCRECAEAVTAWGRQTIRSAIRMAEELGLKVIYGDTDSLFVSYDKEKVERLMGRIEEELGFDIKIDKIYRRVFFTEAKKRYVGLLEDGRIDIVGFEAVRGDWAEIAKEVQEKVTEILLKERSVDKAVEYVQKIIGDLKTGKIPLDKVIIWKTLTKKPEEYSVEAPHVTAARKMLKAGIKVSVNDKIGYIIVKGGGKISTRAEPYMFVKDPSLVDYNYYIDHQIVPAALRILRYFGVSETQLKRAASTAGQRSLFDFFGKK